MAAMNGPRKIIDLDSTPNTKWKLHDAALHLYQNRLWHWERVGCVLCASADGSDYQSQTLRADDDNTAFTCLTHGKLEGVEVEVTRSFTIRIGNVTRTGGTVIDTDEVLFPVEMDAAERERVINQMFDAIEIEERLNNEKSDE